MGKHGTGLGCKLVAVAVAVVALGSVTRAEFTEPPAGWEAIERPVWPAHRDARLNGRGWQRTWVDYCHQRDPYDIFNTYRYLPLAGMDHNFWPFVPFGSYDSFLWDGVRWWNIEDGDALWAFPAMQPGPAGWCDYRVSPSDVKVTPPAGSDPAAFFRAPAVTLDQHGLVILVGFADGAYGEVGYTLKRVTAPAIDAPWTLHPTTPTGLQGIALSSGPMGLVSNPDGSGELWFWFSHIVDGAATIGFARSSDRGATWTALRDPATGRPVDLRPTWLRSRTKALVFPRAVVIGEQVHIWATRWRDRGGTGQGNGAGMFHFVVPTSAPDSVLRNYWLTSTGRERRVAEFGSQVKKGVIPVLRPDLAPAELWGVFPLYGGWAGRFEGQ